MTPRDRLSDARRYLVCDARPREFLAAALRGGVDVIQLRDKALGEDELVTAAREFRAAADAAGALFVLNDRPDLAAACEADGVHVGQDDGEPGAARAAVGPERIVGRSTHTPAQLAAGATVNGSRPVLAALVLALLMGMFAVGLWQRRYLAVLAWEALLGVTMIYAALSLMLASNLAAVLVCVALLAVCGPLFWLLIRVMGRLQVPHE